MNISIQLWFRSNPNYLRYLRENSHWYKILNRNPESLNYFIEEMRNRYRLRTTDKLNDALDKFQMMQRFMNFVE